MPHLTPSSEKPGTYLSAPHHVPTMLAEAPIVGASLSESSNHKAAIATPTSIASGLPRNLEGGASWPCAP